MDDETTYHMNQRCLCCREYGHTTNTCPKDPNIKTLEDPDNENIRIKSIHDNRKIFADTMVTTAQFLKSCAKVPKVDAPNRPAAKKTIEKQKINIFQRGAMNFEDYNYSGFNKHILVNPQIKEKMTSIEADDFEKSSGETAQVGFAVENDAGGKVAQLTSI